MPRGGARPNAGRKRTRERFERPVETAEKRIADRLPELIDRLFGMSEEGNYNATVYLVDRVLGKPRQAVDAEVTGKDGAEIRIKVEYADTGIDPDAPEAPSGAGEGGA